MEFKLDVICSVEDSPQYIKVNIDSARLKKLLSFADIVKSSGVYCVVAFDDSTRWFNDEDCLDETRMNLKTVRVYSYGFGYEAYPRHTEVLCTSNVISFKGLEGKNLDEEESDGQGKETDTKADTDSQD